MLVIKARSMIYWSGEETQRSDEGILYGYY